MTTIAGQLQARLTVTLATLESRPDGGQTPTTTTVVANAAASIRPLTANERLRGGTQLATATHLATLRMPVDLAGQVIAITPAMTASAAHGWTGQVQAFTIAAATDVDGRGRELELVLEERVT